MNERPTYEEMVKEVLLWFDKSTAEDQQRFINTPEENIILYHNTLGRRIRNHFDLWKYTWEPNLKNGIDFSPNHPDAISIEVIKIVYKILS